MENYNRMVIDLLKEALTSKRINPASVLKVKRELSCAITAAKIQDQPTKELELLLKDVEYLNTL